MDWLSNFVQYIWSLDLLPFWHVIIVSAAWFLLGLRTVEPGYRALYVIAGYPIGTVGNGLKWGPLPWPLFKLKKFFCEEDSITLPDNAEVTTSDGVTCRICGSIVCQISDLSAYATKVATPDDEVQQEAMTRIREAIATQPYTYWIGAQDDSPTAKGKRGADTESILNKSELLGSINSTAKKKWGIEIKRLRISEFTPANAEARALVFALLMAEKQAQCLGIYLTAIQQQYEDICRLKLNPSVVYAAHAGQNISIAAYADQMTLLHDAVKEALHESDDDSDESPVEAITEFFAERVPGGRAAVERLRGG